MLSQSESRARNGWETPARDDLLLLAVAVVWNGRECWWIRIRAFLCHFQPQNFRVLYTQTTTSTSQPGFATHSRLSELLLLQSTPHPPFCSCSSLRTQHIQPPYRNSSRSTYPSKSSWGPRTLAPPGPGRRGADPGGKGTTAVVHPPWCLCGGGGGRGGLPVVCDEGMGNGGKK